MKATYIAAELLLATAALALPEIHIGKKHGHRHARPLRKRQTVGTSVYNIQTYSIGGAYYANSGSSSELSLEGEEEDAKMILQSRSAPLRKSRS